MIDVFYKYFNASMPFSFRTHMLEQEFKTVSDMISKEAGYKILIKPTSTDIKYVNKINIS